MLGILYLCLCFAIGWTVCTYAFPNLQKMTRYSYDKYKVKLSSYLLIIPVWFITGTLVITWATYFFATIFKSMQAPLFMANIITMSIALVASVFTYYNQIKKGKKISFFSKNRKVVVIELIFLLSVMLLALVLMWTTFFIRDNRLYIGISVFSDFSPHIGMIRSFSYGNNFPTWYSHFAGEDIKYHFMFQFLVGNLEFLGLRLDYAFNIPSMLSFIFAFMLLYVLAVKITGRVAVGILSCLFFAFRSSKTLFTYLSNLPRGTNLLQSLIANEEFISDTPFENWGLWNLNVYCNQRHLAFGIAVILFIIFLFLPHLYDMFHSLKQIKQDYCNSESSKLHIAFSKVKFYTKFIFFTKEGWDIKDIRMAIASGIILGSLAFFHGAAVIAALLVLFVVAILSKRRLEFAVMAGITIVLSMIQSKYFINGSAVSTDFLFGFIAENKTLFGVASYLERLLGILPFVLVIAFCYEKGVGRYIMLAFVTPLLFAFQVSLTVDVTVNHKYIMMACILLGIFAASFLVRLFDKKKLMLHIVGIGLAIMLTATGIYDFSIVLKNKSDKAIVLDLNDPVTTWIKEHCNSKDIFLTDKYAINQVVLGGAMLFHGWPYFAWSAGYDTENRELLVRTMYESNTPEELDMLVKENNIRYIVVEYNNRNTSDYAVNEENIQATYHKEYQNGEGEFGFYIYDTTKPIYK